jgi:hypothetical protein
VKKGFGKVLKWGSGNLWKLPILCENERIGFTRDCNGGYNGNVSE